MLYFSNESLYGGGGGELEAEMVLPSMPGSFQSYQVVLSVIQYFIPLFIISFAYTRMGVKLWLSQTPGAAQEKRDQMILVNKKKVYFWRILYCAL